MTDNEIISIDEAIRHCYETYFERDDLCRECREEHKQLAKWLEKLKESRNTINRQAVEIEALKTEIEGMENQNTLLLKKKCKDINIPRKIIKSKAIKEFAKRLKEKVKMYNSEGVEEGDLIDDLLTVGETVEIIDNLVKEMTEG